MSRIIFKILSILGLSLITVAIFFLGYTPLIEGKHFFNKYIDTEFAENYSPKKFEKVEIGMELSEVKNLVGVPLDMVNANKNALNKNYYYTRDGKLLHNAKTCRQKGYDDFAWYRSTVEVNSENIVVSIKKGWSFD